MDKNLDFEKLLEQARFLSQLMNNSMNNTGETMAESRLDNSSDVGEEYAGAFSSVNSDIPFPDSPDSQEAIEKAIQAVKFFQALNQNGQTSDNDSAYDKTSVHNEFTEDSVFTEDTTEEHDKRNEDSYTDFSRLYDETFSTPMIKAIKSAVRFVDPKYHKTIGLWIKFMEIQNMQQIYAKRAEYGCSRPEYADWRRGMLLSVRPYISQEKQYTIDILIKVMELKEIMSIMEEMSNGG